MSAVIIASILIMSILPARAWVYPDTTIGAPHTDTNFENFGPRADKIQIRLFTGKTAEFTELESDHIDLTDCPVDSAHLGPWTNGPLSSKIAVVDTGPAFEMYILDMQMNNNTFLPDGSSNLARTASFGNPMADVWLRRAIACVVDRKYTVEQIISGNNLPLLADALYTPLSLAYGNWVHPELNSTKALKAYTYVNADGSANVSKGNKYLDDHGYVYDAIRKRLKNGVPFTVQFYYRSDDDNMRRFATELLQPLLTAYPPNGLGLDVQMIAVSSGGARAQVMDQKKGHLYTGYASLRPFPEHIYSLFHIDNYWHPGIPKNYMYYPGDALTYNIVGGGNYDGGGYGSDLVPYGAPQLSFADPYKTWAATDYVWENPQNYWSWEMMKATDLYRAQYCAYKAQEMLDYWVCGVPVWASRTYTAFHRTYVGDTPQEAAWRGQRWFGVVDQRILGVYNWWSLCNMHPENAEYGEGHGMTVRWSLNGYPCSFNPIYASTPEDWKILNLAYDTLVKYDPYNYNLMPRLASSWTIDTYSHPRISGACTRITLYLGAGCGWSDGYPLAAEDVYFTFVELKNLLKSKGLPPPWWNSDVDNIVGVRATDPWTVELLFDGMYFFAMDQLCNVPILPRHIWKPIIESGSPLDSFNQPNVCSGPWVLTSTADPWSGTVLLEKDNNRACPQAVYDSLDEDITGAKLGSSSFTNMPDYKVNVKDIYFAAKAYGSVAGDAKYEMGEADLNGDYKVDLKDFFTVCRKYGWVSNAAYELSYEVDYMDGYRSLGGVLSYVSRYMVTQRSTKVTFQVDDMIPTNATIKVLPYPEQSQSGIDYWDLEFKWNDGTDKVLDPPPPLSGYFYMKDKYVLYGVSETGSNTLGTTRTDGHNGGGNYIFIAKGYLSGAEQECETLLHEMGHTIGIPHNDSDSEDVMVSSADLYSFNYRLDEQFKDASWQQANMSPFYVK